MKRNLIYSAILLLILLLAVIFQETSGHIFVIISAIMIFVPTIYSVIPFVRQELFDINKNKNKLSHDTFTDRIDDVEEILHKLSKTEHIIQITGSSEKCGKTWLAYKLCDSINHQQKAGRKKKLNYTRAYYYDMRDKKDADINSFVEANIINSKTVLIFDHISETQLVYVLSKQEIYHFQLIYILDGDMSINSFQHSVSTFKEEYIDELQKKIQLKFTALDTMNSDEVKTLYKLTNRNIGKIHEVLRSKESIRWIKSISSNTPTDYDVALQRAKLDLYVGEYKAAFQKLAEIQNGFSDHFEKNNDLYFKFYFIKSDCEHLLNNYENAIRTLSLLKFNEFQVFNENHKIELMEAHYNKHLWQCNNCLEILRPIYAVNISAVTDSFGVLMAKYFIDDNDVPNSEKSSLQEFQALFIHARNTMVDDYNTSMKIKRYQAFYDFYFDDKPDKSKMLKEINEIITTYKCENNRLLANILFLRGEIHRVFGDDSLAMDDYVQVLSLTSDNNIIIQTNAIMYYLVKIKKINYEKEYILLDKQRLLSMCQGKNNYGMILHKRLNSIEFNDPIKKQLIDCFDHRIMPIL